MKITKRQLRRIIKEEKIRLLEQEQLGFNEKSSQSLMSIMELLEQAWKDFRWVEAPGIDEGRLVDLEDRLFDLTENFRDLANEVKKRKI